MSNDLGKQFLHGTKHKHMPPSPQSEGKPQPALELPYDPTLPLIDLPEPTALAVDPVNPRELIERRTTVRQYAATPLTTTELSYLLWCTQGVKPKRPAGITRRTVPSAGSRHAFETLLLVNRVEGLAPGLYRYLALQHKLIRLDAPEDIAARVTDACGQAQVAASAVTFIWVAVTERMTWRYGARGYRYLFLDAGHVCQNLYLAALSIDAGTCAIASYDDDALNALLNLDGTDLFVIYMGTVGKL